MVNVQGCAQQIPPPGYTGSDALEMRDIEGTGETYLEAVGQVEASVPVGFRLLYVRVERDPAIN